MINKVTEKVKSRLQHTSHRLCVGLDPSTEQIRSAQDFQDYIQFIKKATPLASAFKANLAFFESLGCLGWDRLQELCTHIDEDIPLIIDAKRGDIANTSASYAQALAPLNADWITVHPYMGEDSVIPFLKSKNSKGCETGVFVLVHTSNPSAQNFQTLELSNGQKLYQAVLNQTQSWNELHGNCGAVVGASDTSILENLRVQAPELCFLVPGVGAQGGDLQAVNQALNRVKESPSLVNVSRGLWSGAKNLDAVEKNIQHWAQALRF